MRYDVYINERFWKTLEYQVQPDLARIFNDINAARYLGELDPYLIDGEMSVRIIPLDQPLLS